MASDTKYLIRCAIYTRKSSEEGLEQSFNSLEAQREACEAYIASQKHERWSSIATHYDDGGYSGGSMERPALRQLLADIDNGKVDTVVVYKVDRLTRSLADFAKIIERFDAREASFVSVTQQFNTTTSMGRLTLNVLLSFAQFEREVTGERIRDKIAASKRKGMWMGGIVPVGYDIKDRKLVVNPGEAIQVKKIYQLYLDLGCVAKLKAMLDRDRIQSKVRMSAAGIKTGGGPLSRGALYSLLQNPVYIGKNAHREQVYEGEQPGIIPQELWEKVQDRLRANNNARRTGSNSKSPSLLVGLLYDKAGNRFTPSHAVKRGKRYRYYISQAVIHHRGGEDPGPTRIPAQEIERLVSQRLLSLLNSSGELLATIGLSDDQASTSKSLLACGKQVAKSWLAKAASEQRELLNDIVAKIVVHEDNLVLAINWLALRDLLTRNSPAAGVGSLQTQANHPSTKDVFEIKINAKVKRCGGEVRLFVPPDSKTERPARPVPSLIRAIARAHRWPDQIIDSKFHGRRSLGRLIGLRERYAGRILQCAFLAPDIVKAILDGRQPADLTVQKLLRGLPLDWAEQRRKLGFPSISCGHGGR